MKENYSQQLNLEGLWLKQKVLVSISGISSLKDQAAIVEKNFTWGL